ncbi:MAG: hypothetical protein ACE5GG_04935 [Candidatus Omnitrophota bacterium]
MRGKTLFDDILLLGVCCALILGSSGCYALRKKFIRRPKHEPKAEDPVLAFEDYKNDDDPETAYRKYLLYWRSWQEELIVAIENGLSRKKQSACAREALSNLKMARSFLDEDKQNKLDVYLSELEDLAEDIEKGNLQGARLTMIRHRLKLNRRNILRVLR